MAVSYDKSMGNYQAAMCATSILHLLKSMVKLQKNSCVEITIRYSTEAFQLMSSCPK